MHIAFPLRAGRVGATAISLLVLALVLTACPSRTRRVLGPSPPETTVPDTGNAAARARFDDARTQFERDAASAPEAAAAFESIAQEYPQDPIAPYALLYAGIAALKSSRYQKAERSLSEVTQAPSVEPALAQRSRLFLGITYNYQGRYEEALGLLETTRDAIHDEAERVEWLAALAEAHSRGYQSLLAVRYYDEWHQRGSAAERAYIVARLRALAANAELAEVRAAYDDLPARDGAGAAILGARLAAYWSAQGELERARAIELEIAGARRALGLDSELNSASAGRTGSTRRLGAILPLSGRRARVGDLALRGLALATGTFAGIAGAREFEVSVRDTTSLSAGAQSALEALEREQVIAVVGPIDGDSVDAAASRAHALALPMVSLNPRSGRRFGPDLPQGSPYVFHILQSAEDRAEALARYALANGVRTFAVLRPDSGYGRAVSTAFIDAVEAGGGRVVSQASYTARATSFGDSIKSLRGSFEAVFVPEQAARLALIAPALAAADLYARPLSARPPEVGRKILLLSTAEFLSPRYLRSAGRYSTGAVLAPGFYPDREDDIIGDFVRRYQRAYGELPTPPDAYAYDAALVIATAVEAGARTRAELGASMAGALIEGLTGTIVFDQARRRSDDGLLFTVTFADGDLEIRALRD